MSSNGHLPNQPIAQLERVSKRYWMHRDRPGTIRERLTAFGRRRSNASEFWALRDVSFQVNVGETVGIIGHNGSGKTTVLKLLAGITAATRGSVSVAGRCGALIELGAGFHPELSGRDNIFLSGAIQGLSREAIRDRYDSIVDFAELHDFIDSPVKHYSSGMAVRLGFAVAVSTDADLLLVDEALSVGDRAFKEKSLSRVEEMQRDGLSFVMVSHNLEMLARLCHRIVWLDHGGMRAQGSPGAILAEYEAAVRVSTPL